MKKFSIVFIQRCFLALVLTLTVSCEDGKVCSDEFVVSYQRMGDAFESVYGPRTGSFELNALKESLTAFLKDHEGVKCEYKGETLDPTSEVKAFQSSLPKSLQKNEKFKLRSKVVYGEDNRVEVKDAAEPYKTWASATMAQFSPKEWDNSFNLVSKTLEEEFTLCPGERFASQLSASRCSGFLVAPDVVVTAGHCMQSQNDCDAFRWVLDYKDGATRVEQSKVFKCKNIIKQTLNDDEKLDYAVVKLDRAVKDRKFFRIRTSDTVANGQGLVVIGHPSGLPTKVADGASVRSSSPAHYFVANLDTFGGNSGSAVINTSNGVVEGILVRGEEDYKVVDGPNGERCRVVNTCSNSGCEGEEVTKMTSVEGIPLLAHGPTIRRGLYKDKNFPTASEGLPIDFLSYSYDGHTVGGRKFLDRCGIHFYKNESPQEWEDFYRGACKDSREIDQVVDTFGNNFYF